MFWVSISRLDEDSPIIFKTDYVIMKYILKSTLYLEQGIIKFQYHLQHFQI